MFWLLAMYNSVLLFFEWVPGSQILLMIGSLSISIRVTPFFVEKEDVSFFVCVPTERGYSSDLVGQVPLTLFLSSGFLARPWYESALHYV